MRLICFALTLVYFGQFPSMSQEATTLAPTTEELRNRYGPPDTANPNGAVFPDSETFAMRPWVGMTVQYGSDHHACNIELEPGLDLEKSAQFKYLFGDNLPEIVNEAVPSALRGKEIGSVFRPGANVAEYENLILIQKMDFGGVTNVTIAFKRDACPKPKSPVTFPPPPDAKTVVALTPNSAALRNRYGPPKSKSDALDTFTIPPDMQLRVQYGPDHYACDIEITGEPPNQYMPSEKVSEILDVLAPASMRGRQTNRVVFRSSACGEGDTFEYENVGIARIPNLCVPEHPNTEKKAEVKFTRDVCKQR